MIKFDGLYVIIIKIALAIDNFIQDVSLFFIKRSIKRRDKRYKNA